MANDPEISSDSVDYERSSASDKFYDEQWCDQKVTNFYGLNDNDTDVNETAGATSQ